MKILKDTIENNVLLLGNQLLILDEFPESHIDTVITLLPDLCPTGIWDAILRVAKPGAMLLAITTVKYHRYHACAIEDSGWDIRDCICWFSPNNLQLIIVAMKPTEGTFADNALKYGVAGLNIAATRIKGPAWKWETQTDITGGGFGSKRPSEGDVFAKNVEGGQQGRWPANLLFSHHPECKFMLDKQDKSRKTYTYDKTYQVDGFITSIKSSSPYNYGDAATVNPYECHHDCPVKELDKQSGLLTSGYSKPCVCQENPKSKICYGNGLGGRVTFTREADSGGASRFFYCSKEYPQEILNYLCKITRTPTGGIVLDPFMLDGSIALACHETNRHFVGITDNPEYYALSIKQLSESIERKIN